MAGAGQWMGFGLMAAAGAATAVDAWRRRGAASGEARPSWAQFARAAFPVLAIVFLFRSFVYEPFKIPSASMEPGLTAGDFIVVDKFSYGPRWPLYDRRAFDWGAPARGDAVVFKYPVDPSKDFIKRVVGIPGDRVAYKNKRLTVNGEPARYARVGGSGSRETWAETVLGRSRVIATDRSASPIALAAVLAFEGHQACAYSAAGVECLVPAGSYFVMGDNRDNSVDSRYWGFVKAEALVGKADFVWMSWNGLGRVGPISDARGGPN